MSARRIFNVLNVFDLFDLIDLFGFLDLFLVDLGCAAYLAGLFCLLDLILMTFGQAMSHQQNIARP